MTTTNWTHIFLQKNHYLLFLAGIFLLLSGLLQRQNHIIFTKLPNIPGVIEAGIYVFEPSPKTPQGILVLANGYNNTHGNLIREREWQMFAQEHQLVLIEIAFVSHEEDLINGKGYYYASNGSGALLLKAIDDKFPRNLPLLMFGYSGGGHYVARFQAWKPERVKGWATYGVGWWDETVSNVENIQPPGLIICGDDDLRFSACFRFYQHGIEQGRKLLWLGLKDSGHYISPHILPFIQDYFDGLMQNDILDWQMLKKGNTIYGWLPNGKLLDEYQKLDFAFPTFKIKETYE